MSPRECDKWSSADLAATIRSRLQAGERIRRTLADGGRLHIDRPLPFLCVYRTPASRRDAGTRHLVEGEASFLIASGARSARPHLSALTTAVIEEAVVRFGAFLVVEIWSAPDAEVAVAAQDSDIEPTELRPGFVVTIDRSDPVPRTVDALRKSLARISIQRQSATIIVDRGAPPHSPALGPLLGVRDAVTRQCVFIGLSVRPIFRDPASGRPYPNVLRSLKRGIGRALKQAFFMFARTRTSIHPRHYYAMGRRPMARAVWEVNKRLGEIGDSFDFIRQVTPVNAAAVWREFRRGRFQSEPRFYYPPLTVEPVILKRRLYDVPVEKIEDPTLGDLFRERQDELDRTITMLTDIESPRFLLGSLQLYGQLKSNLVDLAKGLLARLPARSRQESADGYIGAAEFAAQAQQEIDCYRARLPNFKASAIVRDDMFSGILCSRGNLLIGQQTQVPVRRVEALLHHEVGTYLLTYYNGKMERLQQLHLGLAGYDAFQEGLACLSEYLVDGLTIPRMRQLAARVVAAHLPTSDADFVETFRTLVHTYRFSQGLAYTITMRTFRGGGLTKDAVYLRGLLEVLDYLRAGGALEPLFIGKIAAAHVKFIQELRLRKVLRAPTLQPRYLGMPEAARRRERVRKSTSLTDLVTGIRK